MVESELTLTSRRLSDTGTETLDLSDKLGNVLPSVRYEILIRICRTSEVNVLAPGTYEAGAAHVLPAFDERFPGAGRCSLKARFDSGYLFIGKLEI